MGKDPAVGGADRRQQAQAFHPGLARRTWIAALFIQVGGVVNQQVVYFEALPEHILCQGQVIGQGDNIFEPGLCGKLCR